MSLCSRKRGLQAGSGSRDIRLTAKVDAKVRVKKTAEMKAKEDELPTTKRNL